MSDKYSTINIEKWERKATYEFFCAFDEPFFGVTVNVDATAALRFCKESNRSLFLHYLHKSLQAANQVEAFRYRIVDGEVRLYEQTHASATIGRPNETFGFSYLEFNEDFKVFEKGAKVEIARIQASTDLLPAVQKENVIHFSASPWLKFTSLTHARHYAIEDSCPKISFGKVTEVNGIMEMPLSIFIHHALGDGLHVGKYVEIFQALLDVE